MANVKISQLPEYTGNTSGSWLIMNNSGETTTYKVQKENIIPAGSGLFAQTGSFWNTTNNIGITGSLNVTGSSHRIVGNTTLTGSLNVSGSIVMTRQDTSSSFIGNTSIVELTSTHTTSPFVSLLRLTNKPVAGGPLYWGDLYKESGSFMVRTSQQVGTNTFTNRDAIVIKDTLSGATTYSPVEFKRNVEVTGSLNVSGSASLATNPSLNVVGNIRFTNPPGVSSYQNVIEFSSGSVPESGSVIQYLPSTDVLLLKGYRNNSIVSIGQINGKNNIIGNTTVTGSFSQSGSVYITGSVQGNVNALTISSNTASLNLDNGNFFTLQLVSGSATHINPSNIKPGQTVNIRVNTTGSATVNFPSSVKQISGSAYVPTTTTGVDVLTLISFDSSNLYLANVKNLI